MKKYLYLFLLAACGFMFGCSKEEDMSTPPATNAPAKPKTNAPAK